MSMGVGTEYKTMKMVYLNESQVSQVKEVM